MKKTFLIGTLIAVSFAVVAVYMFTKDKDEKVMMTPSGEDVSTTENTEVVVTNPVSGTDTMYTLIARGEDLECSISYSSAEVESSVTNGTVFTSQGKLRGDFLVTEGADDVVSSMIVSDGDLYSWTAVEGKKYGMKITLEELEASKTTTEAPEAKEVVSLEQSVDYECNPWKEVDRSIFVPPTDIIFSNYSDLMNRGMEYGNVYGEEGVSLEGQSPCSLCDQVKGEGRDECRKTFSCQ